MSYRLGKLVRKYRVWLSAVAAILSAVLIGAIVSVWMAFRASEAEQVARAVSEFLESDLLPRPARTHRPSPVTSRS